MMYIIKIQSMLEIISQPCKPYVEVLFGLSSEVSIVQVLVYLEIIISDILQFLFGES